MRAQPRIAREDVDEVRRAGSWKPGDHDRPVDWHIEDLRVAPDEVLDAQPGLRNAYSPWAPRLERPLTKFERTGLEKGHEVRDLVYVRV